MYLLGYFTLLYCRLAAIWDIAFMDFWLSQGLTCINSEKSISNENGERLSSLLGI